MKLVPFTLIICLGLWGVPAIAGILPENTRVIFDGTASSRSFIVANQNPYPILVQTWVDHGLGDPDHDQAPFVINPPIFKMQPDGIQVLKIIYTGDQKQTDFESQFWLNLYEIPGKKKQQSNQKPETNHQLDLSIQTQLKVFYRPAKILKMNIEEIAKQLKFNFKKIDNQIYLTCENPTPYFISFSKIALISNKNSVFIEDYLDQMVAPNADQIYPIKYRIDDLKYIEFSVIAEDGFAYSFKYDYY